MGTCPSPVGTFYEKKVLLLMTQIRNYSNLGGSFKSSQNTLNIITNPYPPREKRAKRHFILADYRHVPVYIIL